MIISKYLSNLFGWSTNRKIVVIESDDWGSIRIPSRAIRDKYIKKGIPLDTNIFTKFDSLESPNDVNELLETLNSAKSDIYGQNPRITMLSLPGNPNFEKIEHSRFENYYCEPVSVTYEKYGYNTINILKEGFVSGEISAELHGREHLHVASWLKCLRNDEFKITKEAFKDKFYGIQPGFAKENRKEYQAAFDIDHVDELVDQKEILVQAISLFESEYGLKPKFFVPPNGPYNDELDATLYENGIRYINAAKNRIEPIGNSGSRRRFHYLGQLKKSSLRIITRNVIFEPVRGGDTEVQKALDSIRVAFKMKKPAVISSHRANYIGGIDKKNRIIGNRLLAQLLLKISKKWPDVEFMTSTELGDLISKKIVK